MDNKGPTLVTQRGIEGALEDLKERVVSCERCPRLRGFCEGVARKRRRAFIDWEYWGRPLPGFGDPKAELLIVGLAPAQHGGLRTGRMFTGDSSGEWLARALHENGFANQPLSVSREDGLRLNLAYVTAVVRCAPPANRPTAYEIRSCSEYLAEELRLLRNVKVVLTLGRIAFASYLSHVGRGALALRPRFSHGAIYRLGGGLPILVSSYHPSRQNTQTGRLTWEMWLQVFQKIRYLLDHSSKAEGGLK